PIREVQFGNGSLRRQRSGIDHPTVWDEREHFAQERFAKLLAPKALEIPVPQQRKHHLLFEKWLWRRREKNFFLLCQFKDATNIGHVRQIEQLKEAINRIAFLKIREVCIDDTESFSAQALGNPFHLRPIR